MNRSHKSDRLRRLERLLVLLELTKVVRDLHKPAKRKRRCKKQHLPYHKRRRRVVWDEWVRDLGPEDFYTHHRMRRETYERLLKIVEVCFVS